MKRYFVIAMCLAVAASAVYAATKEQKRLENCGVVVQEVLNIPDNLPQQVLAKTECVIVFPSALRLAFGMGKEYGRGAMVCRTGKEFNGPWGCRSPIRCARHEKDSFCLAQVLRFGIAG